MNTPHQASRRSFLKTAAVLGGGLLIGVPVPVHSQTGEAVNGGTPMGLFLRVAPDGAVTVIVPVVEMGQGAQSALAMIIVDELGADWNRISVVPPPDLVNARLMPSP